MKFFKRAESKTKELYEFLVVLITATILRITHIGYSDFQGDEFKALFRPDPGQSASEFLLSQRKGPVQFIITYVLQLFDPTYSHEWLIRLPFAIAGILAVVYFYKLVRMHFGRKIAFYSSLLFSTNGFFIAFARIVQYQSFVILFMILALYAFTMAYKCEKWSIKGIYLGFIFWGISILSHYDGVFIAPFVAYLLFRWSEVQIVSIKSLFKTLSNIKNLKHVVLGSILLLVMLAAFYVPFVLSLDEATLSYWSGRIEGTGGKMSSSMYLFSVYQPIYVIQIYLLLFIAGVVSIFKKFIGVEMLLMLVRAKFRINFAPLLILFSNTFLKYSALTLWFALPLIFLELIVDIPGTHIYTYLVPMFIILGFGLNFAEELSNLVFKKWSKYLIFVFYTILFVFLFAQSYAIFVDHNEEYPWERETFMFWVLPQPTPIFHLSMFGFPYYRSWEEIGHFVTQEEALVACPNNKEVDECPYKVPRNKHYSTNERSSISRNHIPFRKDTDLAGYYVRIHGPQSFTDHINSDKGGYWGENYDPVKTTYRCKYPSLAKSVLRTIEITFTKETNHSQDCDYELVPAADIYYMPAGSKQSLIDFGF